MALAIRSYGTVFHSNLKCNRDQCGSHCREVSFHIVAIAETAKFLLINLMWYYSLHPNEAGSVYNTENQLIVWCSYLTNSMCEGKVGTIQSNSAPVLKHRTLTTRMITRIPKDCTRLR